MLQTTTNLKLKIAAKTHNSSLSFTGLAVPQKLKTNSKQLSFGSKTIDSDGNIVINNTTTVSTSRTNIGKVNELTTNTTSSIIPYNKNVAIATFTITPSTNFKISNPPSVSVSSGNNSNLNLFIEKTPTLNKFNIVCNSSRAIKSRDDVNVDLNYSVARVTTPSTNTIKRLYLGSSTINKEGEERLIKIYGSPSTPFELSVLDSSDNSILTNTNSTFVLPVGVKQSLSQKLNKKGHYFYKQRFPSLPTIRVTKVNGSMAASGATKVIFDSLTDVQVGDEIFLTDANNKFFADGETIKVLTLNPDGDNANECELTKSIIAADNRPVAFKRSTTYKINLETSGTKDSSIASTFPTQTFNQYTGSVIKVIGTAVTGAAINGGGSGAANNQYYGFEHDGKNKQISLIYTLTGKTFTQASNHPVPSDVALTSGNVEFGVSSIRATGTGTTEYKLYILILIDKVGIDDSVITVSLDNIVS